MTNTVRLEQAMTLLWEHSEIVPNPPVRLKEIRELLNEVLENEKANENHIRGLWVNLCIAKKFLKDVVWLMNSVPNFSDGVRKSHDMTRDINAFLQG